MCLCYTIAPTHPFTHLCPKPSFDFPSFHHQRTQNDFLQQEILVSIPGFPFAQRMQFRSGAWLVSQLWGLDWVSRTHIKSWVWGLTPTYSPRGVEWVRWRWTDFWSHLVSPRPIWDAVLNKGFVCTWENGDLRLPSTLFIHVHTQAHKYTHTLLNLNTHTNVFTIIFYVDTFH